MGDYETYGPYEVFRRNYDITNKGELVPFYLGGEYIGDICKISINHQLIDCIKAFELDSLGEFIRRHKSLNDDTRSFIADIVEGKIKRPKGRPRDIRRDYHIASDIEFLIRQGKNLTSNSKESGASFITGQMYGIEEDAALKAYQRMKLRLEEDREELRWNGWD